MKKSHLLFLLVLVGLTVTTLSSCKKSNNAADDSVSAQDANTVTNAMSSTSDDAAAAAGQVSSYKSLITLNTGNNNLFVGATITDTSSSGITITYDGTTYCNGITRSGTITIQNTGGIPWHEQGAQLKVTYNNLVIYDEVSHNSYTLSGIHTITNETGGLAWQVIAFLAPTSLTPTASVTHRIQTPSGAAGMTITFPGGSQRNWTVDRTRNWTSSGTSLTVSLYAEGSGHITETGTNRFGETFTNEITSTISADNNAGCSWKPFTGTFIHEIASRQATVLFGTNATGTQIGSATTCGLGFYITYTNGSTTRNRFVPYW